MYSELCPVAGILVKRGQVMVHSLDLRTIARYLTRDRFVTAVRTVLVTSSVNPSHYAGHSFRIGAVTTAVNCGLQDSLNDSYQNPWLVGKLGVRLVHSYTKSDALCSVMVTGKNPYMLANKT